jgi:hypothetical protein
MAEEQFISGLDELERDLNRLPEALEKAFVREVEDIRFLWKIQTISVDAIDTRAYLQSIAEQRISAREFHISNESNPDVFYGDIIERGRSDLRKDGQPVNYPGRFPAGKALEQFDVKDQVEIRTTEAFDQILKH